MSDLKPQAESLESLLSTAIGLLMRHKERIGYKPNSVIAKFVDECVERLKDWPYTTAAQPAQAGQVLTDRHTLQAQGKHPAPCARFCEANAFRAEARELTRLAQPITSLTTTERARLLTAADHLEGDGHFMDCADAEWAAQWLRRLLPNTP